MQFLQLNKKGIYMEKREFIKLNPGSDNISQKEKKKK